VAASDASIDPLDDRRPDSAKAADANSRYNTTMAIEVVKKK